MDYLRSAILNVAVGGMALFAMPAAGADLLSHRAAYRLTLQEGDQGGGISHVDGGMVIEWRASCDGWISNQRLGFIARGDEDGDQFTYDVRFSSWESRDNTKLRFTVRSYDGDRLRDEFKGEAALDQVGGKGLAHFERPAEEKFPLPAGTLFPTEHLRRLIAAAEAGEHFVSSEVFDGSGGHGLTQIAAVIGVAPPIAATDGAAEVQSWHVSLAYYGNDKNSDTPDFETNFNLAADGVIRDMRMNYGNFVLHADLEKLEPLSSPGCP